MTGKWPQGWREASYSDEMVPEGVRKTAVSGQVYRNPQTGHTLQKQATGRWKLVSGDDRMEKPSKSPSSSMPDVSKMEKLAEGNYGIVYKDPKSGHAVKTLKPEKEWGPHEVELGKKWANSATLPKSIVLPTPTSRWTLLTANHYGLVDSTVPMTRKNVISK